VCDRFTERSGLAVSCHIAERPAKLSPDEDLVATCEEESRYEFMVVGLPLRLPGGTGSPWNPIAIF
jgi:hypothetical protein